MKSHAIPIRLFTAEANLSLASLYSDTCLCVCVHVNTMMFALQTIFYGHNIEVFLLMSIFIPILSVMLFLVTFKQNSAIDQRFRFASGREKPSLSFR